MKIRSNILMVLALSLTACSKGTVVVSGSVPPTPAVNGADAPSSRAGDGPIAAKDESGKIFFERVMADDGVPLSVTAVNFLAQGAQPGSAPFGALLRVPQDFGSRPMFVPGLGQVTYLRSTGIGSDSLVLTDLTNWRTQPIFAFPELVADFALSSSRTLLAWVDRNGGLSVTQLEGAAPVVQSIPLGGYRAKSVSWNADATRLLMRSDKDVWVFARSDAESTMQQLARYPDIAAAAFSPKGDQIALVGRADRMLRIYGIGELKLPAAPFTVRAQLESSELYDFGWSPVQGFTYWVRLSGGSQEIRVLDSKQGPEKALARLSVSAAIAGGVVCPGWSTDGKTLYFSDFVDGEFVIERLDGTGGTKDKTAELIAEPPATDEGYICPQGAFN